MLHETTSLASTPKAAYIHVPFCAHRCGYCDFTLVAHRDDLIADYLRALEQELRGLGTPQRVSTLFLGGGTPTHLAASQLAELCNLLKRWFVLDDDAEFTVEANPAGLRSEKVNVIANAGVNRISLGVQSFDAQILKTLERDHLREDVIRAVAAIRERIDNIAFDLIFAVPGQSTTLWRQTLDEAVALNPKHISTYGLTFEKGTAYWSRRNRGEMRQTPEEIEQQMYAAALDTLPERGLVQYEISNFAQPGFECCHNQVYWRGEPYWGFGPGAAGYLNGQRQVNHRSVTTWLKRVQSGQSAIAESERLDPESKARELAVLLLRRNVGIAMEKFAGKTGFSLVQLAGDAIKRHCEAGLLEESQGHLRLTRAGRFVADTIVADFL